MNSDTLKQCFTNTDAWETTPNFVSSPIMEGPTVLKIKDLYYLFYSANHFQNIDYAVGYATSKSPLGPYKKAQNNPIVQKNIDHGGDVSGTGHNSVIISPDGSEMFCVYHGRTTKTGNKRVVFIDRMEILSDGTLAVHGPTTNPQPVPFSINKIENNSKTSGSLD